MGHDTLGVPRHATQRRRRRAPGADFLPGPTHTRNLRQIPRPSGPKLGALRGAHAGKNRPLPQGWASTGANTFGKALAKRDKVSDIAKETRSRPISGRRSCITHVRSMDMMIETVSAPQYSLLHRTVHVRVAEKAAEMR
jgi:hypothetical protein